MHPIRRTLAVVGAIVAVMALAPVASAGSLQAFHLDKTCTDNPPAGLAALCTVQHSDFKWIPAGTDIRYPSANDDGSILQARIETKNGSTDGTCTFTSQDDGICVFNSGTGRLAQFNLEVVVSANADLSIWYWDGSYWFGN